MPEQTSSIISKVWGLCNPLRDGGVSYGDYLEQLDYFSSVDASTNSVLSL